MKATTMMLLLITTACGYVVEPGHRGLFFDPRGQGLQREVLMPGHHYTGAFGRVDDFDVTYSTHLENIETTSTEGLRLGLRMEVIYRPKVDELYELDTEIGPGYYDEVVGPEFRSAVRGVFAHHSYMELLQKNEAIENEIEEALRRRISGKHVEVSSVTLEALEYAPDIAQAIQAKLVGEQEAARQKVQIENAAMQEKLKAQADLAAKQRERTLAEEQAKLDTVRATSQASVKLAEARAEAERIELLAKAHAAENASITPLAVQMRGYQALENLGGDGTHVMLGDWSHVPAFMFPTQVMAPSTAGAAPKPPKS